MLKHTSLTMRDLLDIEYLRGPRPWPPRPAGGKCAPSLCAFNPVPQYPAARGPNLAAPGVNTMPGEQCMAVVSLNSD